MIRYDTHIANAESKPTILILPSEYGEWCRYADLEEYMRQTREFWIAQSKDRTEIVERDNRVWFTMSIMLTALFIIYETYRMTIA